MRRLSQIQEYRTACKLYVVTDYEKVNGKRKPIYEEANNSGFFAKVKSYGGTETNENGRIKIIDTIEVTCTYRPDIKYLSRIEIVSTGELYEVISKPENIDMRGIELFFKCQAVVE